MPDAKRKLLPTGYIPRQRVLWQTEPVVALRTRYGLAYWLRNQEQRHQGTIDLQRELQAKQSRYPTTTDSPVAQTTQRTHGVAQVAETEVLIVAVDAESVQPRVHTSSFGGHADNVFVLHRHDGPQTDLQGIPRQTRGAFDNGQAWANKQADRYCNR